LRLRKTNSAILVNELQFQLALVSSEHGTRTIPMENKKRCTSIGVGNNFKNLGTAIAGVQSKQSLSALVNG